MNSAAAAALNDVELRKTRIAAVVCCNTWFGFIRYRLLFSALHR
jgi:hypothetical protein